MSCQVPLRTAVHELVNNRFTSSYTTQINAIKQSKPFSTYQVQYNLYNDLYNTKQKTDPITEEAKFWKDALTKIEGLPPEFIMYWHDKFASVHPKVKSEVEALTNLEDSVLQKISDSISNTARQDENVSPRYSIADDVEFDSMTPSPLTSILQDKLHVNVLSNVLNATVKTSSFFNQNINKIYDGSLQTTSHGTNLATDLNHNNRLSQNKQELLEIAADFLGSVYETVAYFTNFKLNNIQKIESFVFDFDVEGTSVQIDLLGNKANKLNDNIKTTNLLS